MAKKKTARRVTKKTTARKAAKPARRASGTRAKRAGKAAAPKHELLIGVITHTELASADPEATRAWCRNVLGWKFGPSMPTPEGPYHMWQFRNGTGGGIRSNNPPEVPGSIPYITTADIKKVFAKALQAGAEEMLSPIALTGGAGWIAIVAAPGGVPIGFWAKK